MAYLITTSVPTLPSPMTLLRGGVPLSLLMDLVLGPQSEDLLRGESGPGARLSGETG